MIAKAEPLDKLAKANKTERAYGQILEMKLLAGEIKQYWFQEWTFVLAPDCRFTPDYVVQMPDEYLQVHEVKGFMRDDALVKLKVFRKLFPMRTFVVKKVKSTKFVEFEKREISPQEN